MPHGKGNSTGRQRRRLDRHVVDRIHHLKVQIRFQHCTRAPLGPVGKQKVKGNVPWPNAEYILVYLPLFGKFRRNLQHALHTAS